MESIDEVFDRLRVTEGDDNSSDTAVGERGAITSLSSVSAQRPCLICDAFYGFPAQKRPRKERINAVSKQLTNFLQWRRQAAVSTSSSYECNSYCRVSVLGNEDDVQAVQNRMNELAAHAVSVDSKEDITASASDDDDVEFKSNITIHRFLENEGVDIENEVVYLSPDAHDTLSSTLPPPRIVVIGMLIDRNVTTNRSLGQAKTLMLKAAKLPLDELNVRKLIPEEPLNVDTVMELMQRWHWNFDKLSTQRHECDVDAERKKAFIDAVAWAMKSQRDRHPNRTIHLS
jgi:hypothetical protein